MTIEYYNKDEVWGKIIISPNGIMSGKFNIIAIGDNDLSSHFHVRAYEEHDIKASLLPRVIAKSDRNSFFDVKYKNESSILSTIQAYEGNYLDATMNIRPFGSMMGIFEIIEPPRITEDLVAIQDSTVRSFEEHKYINYGKFSTMMVGINGEGEYLGSYVKFPLSEYPETLTVLKGTLRLYYTANMEEDIIKLYNLNKDWNEYGVTYANRPLLTDLVTDKYTINKEKRYIEFDVLDYVQDLIANKKNNFGFGITSNNSKSYSFFTKESSLQPTLTITYFDTRIFNLGRADLKSTIFAYGVGSRDLNSFLSIKQTADDSLLKSTIYIHRYEDPMDYDITATLMVSTPDLHSNILVVQRDDNDLVSMLTLRQYREEEKISYLNVNTPELYGTFYTRHYDDFDSYMTTRAYKYDDVQSYIGVSRDFAQGYFYVMPKNDFDSFITIHQHEKYEIKSELRVSNPDLYGALYVKHRDDLDSHITIHQHFEKELVSMIGVSVPDLHGTLYVKYRDDFDSYMTARAFEKDEKESFIGVSKPNLYGTLLVTEYNDLHSTMIGRQSDDDEKEGFFNVSTPELYSSVIAKVQNSIDIFMGVSVPELNVIMITRAYKEEDFEATFLPRVIGADDIHGTLDALNRYRSGAYWYII